MGVWDGGHGSQVGVSVQMDLVVSLTVDPVGPAAVVTQIVLLDQFVGPISQNVVGQFGQPVAFGGSGSFGVMLTGFLQDQLELVVADGDDQVVTSPVVELLSNLGPTVSRDADLPCHRFAPCEWW